MDKSAKHDAKYYEWISNSKFIRFMKRRKYKNKEFRIQKISVFKRSSEIKFCLYSKIYNVAFVLLRRSYVPDKTLSTKEERMREISYMLDKDNIRAVWEEATKIAL